MIFVGSWSQVMATALLALIMTDIVIAAPSPPIPVMKRNTASSNPFISPDKTIPSVVDSPPDAIVLMPTPSSQTASRGQRSNVRLQKSITLNWHHPEAFTKAELTGDWSSDDKTKVIHMDDFEDTLKAVGCKNSQMTLEFLDLDAYNTAIAEWGWIDKKNRQMAVIFTNDPLCSEDSQTAAYTATSITYQSAIFTMTVNVTREENIGAIMPNGRLEVKTMLDPDDIIAPSFHNSTTFSKYDFDDKFNGPAKKVRRDADDRNATPYSSLEKRAAVRGSFNLDKWFSGNIIDLETDIGSVSLDCVSCGTRGRVTASIVMEFEFVVPVKSYVSFESKDVEAFVNLKLRAALEKVIEGHKTFLSITPFFILVPYVFYGRLGIDIGIGWDVTLTAEGELTWGVLATMTDGLYRTCFFGCDSVNEGFDWNFAKAPITAKGEVAVGIGLHTFINPLAEVRFFEAFAYEAGIAILAPKFAGDVAFQGNTEGGICGDPDTNVGLNVELQYGYEGYAYAGRDYQDTDFRHSFFDVMHTFYEECFPLYSNGADGIPAFGGEDFSATLSQCTSPSSNQIKAVKDLCTQGLYYDALWTCVMNRPTILAGVYNRKSWATKCRSSIDSAGLIGPLKLEHQMWIMCDDGGFTPATKALCQQYKWKEAFHECAKDPTYPFHHNPNPYDFSLDSWCSKLRPSFANFNATIEAQFFQDEALVQCQMRPVEPYPKPGGFFSFGPWPSEILGLCEGNKWEEAHSSCLNWTGSKGMFGYPEGCEFLDPKGGFA